MNGDLHTIIIGGGLAGLTAAIDLAQSNIPVTLIEKDTYPRHKVCGEYISNEVLPYFKSLQIDIERLKPSHITRFQISTQSGKVINSALPLGGFGVSRYVLDHYLWEKARSLGVTLIKDQVVDIQFDNDVFEIKTSGQKEFTAKFVIGAYGKRSVLDRNLDRESGHKKYPWLAVKAHYSSELHSDIVALHNFKGGYCGISKVENDIVNVCYLVHYKIFKKYKNIQVFQDQVICKNPHLDSFFKKATPIFKKPITISQINFDKKEPVFNHVFMTGDAAGLIHPLCGNGMAMAIQSAQIISEIITARAGDKNLSREDLEHLYIKQWKQAFQKRLVTGRLLQYVLLHNGAQQIIRQIAKVMPSLVPKIIRQTHGKPLLC